jgi:hypothetical protein
MNEISESYQRKFDYAADVECCTNNPNEERIELKIESIITKPIYQSSCTTRTYVL